VALEFDNSFKGDDLFLKHKQTQPQAMKCLKVAIKYIISNVFWLKKTELFAPKSESYFIVDELNANSHY
jgi:hypothetical protein